MNELVTNKSNLCGPMQLFDFRIGAWRGLVFVCCIALASTLIMKLAWQIPIYSLKKHIPVHLRPSTMVDSPSTIQTENDIIFSDEPTDGGTSNCTENVSDATGEKAVIGSRLMLLPRGDGFGTHVVALLSALAYCDLKNLTYVHRPWDHVGHCPPGMSIADWSADLEHFTGLVHDEVKWSDLLGPVPAVPQVRFGRDADKFFNLKFLASMRERYMSSLPPKNNSISFVATRDTVRVAVHIRRGDIGEFHKGRFTNITETLSFMKLVGQDIAAKGNSRNITFHVYSEGDSATFEELNRSYGNERVFLHLGEQIQTSFHDMVSADVLIMAKSGLSYAAALLSAGSVYYQPFWVMPLSHWRVCT